jgi:LysR family transcriptional regulator, low CO2-responsive transcriptional regulator
MRITWNQLRLFEAVARNNSFTRAAEELHVVQPTVSAQIKQLTDTVGLPVFEQVGKKIYLTDAGQELYSTARELFDTWDRFEMKVSDLKGAKAGKLRVTIVTTAKYFVPRLLGPFCQHYPGIDVALEIVNRDRALERLVDNLDDLYIMGVPPEHLAIEKIPFLQNPLVVIAAKGHELADRKRITLARLAKERFILREKGSGTRIAAEEFFNKRKIELSVKMELSNNEAIKWAVAGGMGLSIVSQHALMLEPMQDKIAVLDVEGFPIIRSWYIVYPAGKQLSVVAATFFEYLKEEAEMLQDELFAPKRTTERAKK